MWPWHLRIHATSPCLTSCSHLWQPYCWSWKKSKAMLLVQEQNKSHVVDARTKQKPYCWCQKKTEASLNFVQIGFFKVVAWISLSCKLDLSKLIYSLSCFVDLSKISMYFLPFFKQNQAEVWSQFQSLLMLLLWTIGDKWVKILNALGLLCLWQCFNLEFKTDYIICNLSTVLKDAASEDLVVISTEDTDKDR